MEDTPETIDPVVNTPTIKTQPIVIQGASLPAQNTKLSTSGEIHVDKSKGAQPGNQNRMKWPTPEERREACQKACDELKMGYPKEYLYTADWDTIQRYMKDFPLEFPSEAINDAIKDGKRQLLAIGYNGMKGKIPGFVPRTWEFVIQNMTGWKLRQDHTTNDKELPTPILGGTNAVSEDNSDK